MKSVFKRMLKSYKLVNASNFEYIVSLIAGVLFSLLNIAIALLYGDLVSQVAAGKSFNDMLGSILFTVAVTVVNVAVFWFSNYYESRVFVHNCYYLRDKFTEKLLRSRYLMIASSDSSKYINMLTNDVENVCVAYFYQAQYFIICVITIISSFVASVILDWRIALSMVGFTVLMGILPLFIKKKLDNSMVEASKSKASYIGSLKENLLGITVIKNNNAEEVCGSVINRANKKNYLAEKKRNLINSVAGGAGLGVRSVAVLVLIIFTCYLVSINEVKAGAVLSIYSVGMTFYGAILNCSAIVTNLFGAKGIRNIVEEITDRENESTAEKLSFSEAIELNEVSFKYNGDDDREILSGINMKFERGGKYLVIGKSGSGKSTVLKLLCKFYDDYKGTITFDGKNYADMNENSINAVIAYCQQNGYLFNRSLRDNIDFAFSGDKEKLERIINTVCLNDFVSTLKDGLDTVIDEEVNQVSGGEKLRINLARSLFRDSEILLLDEVTSALDKKTSEIVERNILKIDKTLINVCHKFNDDTLPEYDRIYIIENGKIVEDGTFKELENNEKFIEYRNLNNAENDENPQIIGKKIYNYSSNSLKNQNIH